VADTQQKLIHRIDKLHMEFPFASSRILQSLLAQDGFKVGRLHDTTPMTRMAIEVLHRKHNA
jgi:putative transposase